jgi:hypothetical protein
MTFTSNSPGPSLTLCSPSTVRRNPQTPHPWTTSSENYTRSPRTDAEVNHAIRGTQTRPEVCHRQPEHRPDRRPQQNQNRSNEKRAHTQRRTPRLETNPQTEAMTERWPHVRPKGQKRPKPSLDSDLSYFCRAEWIACARIACWICGEELDPQNTTGIWCRDHLIPWSAGGCSCEHNLRLAHFACNESRSNYALPIPRFRNGSDLWRTATCERGMVTELLELANGTLHFEVEDGSHRRHIVTDSALPYWYAALPKGIQYVTDVQTRALRRKQSDLFGTR